MGGVAAYEFYETIRETSIQSPRKSFATPLKKQHSPKYRARERFCIPAVRMNSDPLGVSGSDANDIRFWENDARRFLKDNTLYNKLVNRLEAHCLKSEARVAGVAGMFETLATQWRNETKFLSSITDKALHPCYQRIIGLGPEAIPIILMELRTRGGHWFWALESITGENPVLPEHSGNTKNMAHDWIEWGKRKGYLL